MFLVIRGANCDVTLFCLQDCRMAAMDPVSLAVGSLSLAFEPTSGMVRHVRLGEIEVLRGVYAAVRRENWGTHSHRVRDVRIERGEQGFAVRWTDASGPVEWQGELRSEGTTIRYQVAGTVSEDFDTMRTGVCVLHPAREARGAACRVEHTDGSVEEAHFPNLIAPHQPFFDIRAITHEVRPGVWLEVRMEGEVFEMEDQRNWTDASFKTYCRPLDWPKPYALRAGDEVRHKVTIRLLGEARESASRSTPVTIKVGEEVGPMPHVGAWFDGNLRDLPLDIVAVGIDFSSTDAEEKLEAAAEASLARGAELEVHVLRGEPEAIEEAERHTAVARFMVRDAGLRRELRGWALRAALGTATASNFTELNRERPTDGEVDVIGFATNAQVHAFDDLSIVETLEGLALVTESAQALAPGRPVRVGPVKFGPADDARAASAFGRAWHLAALAALAEAGAEGVVFAIPETLQDLAEVLAEVRGRSVRRTVSSDPLRIRALATESGAWLISLSASPEPASLAGKTVELAPFEIRKMTP